MTRNYMLLCLARTETRNLKDCFSAFRSWFAENGLTLNPDKSEARILSTAQRNKEFSSLTSVSDAGSPIKLARQIKLLLVTLDVNLNFSAQIKILCKASYVHILALRNMLPPIT